MFVFVVLFCLLSLSSLSLSLFLLSSLAGRQPASGKGVSSFFLQYSHVSDEIVYIEYVDERDGNLSGFFLMFCLLTRTVPENHILIS